MQLPLRVRIRWQHPRKAKSRRRTKAARYRRPHHVRRRLHRSHITQLRWITRHQRRPKVPTPPPRRDDRSKHNSPHHPPPRPAIVPPPRPVRSHNHRPTLYQIRQSPARPYRISYPVRHSTSTRTPRPPPNGKPPLPDTRTSAPARHPLNSQRATNSASQSDAVE